jgi:N-acetylglucosamine-6-phosphate deacetylase
MKSDRGYFDLQVNGYAGVDFNKDDLTPEELQRACEALDKDSIAGCLATIITEEIDQMAARLSRLVQLREELPLAKKIIQGLHIEGPFLSPEDGYRGAHPVDAIRPAEIDTMKRLLDAAQGLARLVTLAPEHDPGLRVTKFLVDNGVRVSAGHCNPTLDHLERAIDTGLTLFTHLGNGCPMLLPRHDNIIQRALSLSDRLWICFIADGAHVPFHALRNYLRVAGSERCIVVTDAIAPAGLGPGRYTLSRWDIVIGEDRVARAPDGSHLIGSAMTMPQAMLNLVQYCQLSENEALTMAAANPCKALGIRDDSL